MSNDQMNRGDTAARSLEERPAQGLWKPAVDRPDPVEMLIESSRGRLESLAPIRHARMLTSPFAFFRGSAAAMAYDLVSTPVSGLLVQLCGDCHLGNFGGFATPERRLIFDLLDFDETIPGPWEWDVKRLGASFHLAGRDIGLSEANCEEAVLNLGRAYRQRLIELAQMKTLDMFYASIGLDTYIDQARDARTRKGREQMIAKARKRTSDQFFAKSVRRVDGRWRIVDEPPFLFHPPRTDRFDVVDVAMKVVGVGSVGTRCGVILLMAGDDDPLILQIKEARHSALEQFVGRSRYENMGQRVVMGQRLIHSAELCGWALAQAHARSGDAAQIGGYMGKSDAFDGALAAFSQLYADQTEQDHQVMRAAARSGKLAVDETVNI